MYIPLRYTYVAKYSKAYVFDQILLVNTLLAIVATSCTIKDLCVHAVSIPIFVVAFMCIYEIGYFENDIRASKLEAAPVLTNNVARFTDYSMEPFAWISAFGLTALGGVLTVLCGLQSAREMLIESAIWGVAMGAVRWAFTAYNRRDVARRPPLYVLLQVLKYGSIFVIFRPTLLGAIATASQIVMMATVYWVYRLGGRQRTINEETMRVICAGAIATPILLAEASAGFGTTMSAALVIAWLLLRLAKPPLIAILRARSAT